MNLANLTQSPLPLFAAVATAHALAVISPGPDLAMVIRQTLAQGRNAGLRTALGIGCGIGVHVAYGLFGLSWAITHYPALLDTLKLLGATVLLWIGAQAIRAQPRLPSLDSSSAAATARTGARDFLIGFGTNIFNVKAMLFFVALCAAMVSAHASTGLKLALGLWMMLVTAGWFAAVAMTFAHPRLRARFGAGAHWIDRAMGAILLMLGVTMLLSALS